MKRAEKSNANARHRPSAAIDALFTDAIAKFQIGAAQTIARHNADSTMQNRRAIADTRARFHEQITKIWAQAQHAIVEEKARANETVEREAKVKTEAEKKAVALTDELDQLKAEFAGKEEIHAEQIANIKADAERTIAEERDRANKAADEIIRIRTESETAIAELKAEYEQRITDIESEIQAKEESCDQEIARIKEESEKTIAKIQAECRDQVSKFKAEAEKKAVALTDELDQLKAEFAGKEEIHAEQIANIKADAERTVAEEKERANKPADEIIRIRTESETAIAELKAEYEQRITNIESEIQAKEESCDQEIARIKEESEKTIAKIQAECRDQISKFKAEAEDAIAEQKINAQPERKQTPANDAAPQEANDTNLDTPEATVEDKTLTISETEKSVAGDTSRAIQEMAQSPPHPPDERSLAALRLFAKDIMQKQCVWGSPEDTIEQTLRKMQQCGVRYVMIGEDERLEGIVSKSDLKGAVSFYLRPQFAKWRQPLDDATLHIKVKWIMSRPVHVTGPDVPLTTIIRNMSGLRVCVLPVVDQYGKVMGLVSDATVFEAILRQNSKQDTCSSEDMRHPQPGSPRAPDHTRTPPTRATQPSPVPA